MSFNYVIPFGFAQSNHINRLLLYIQSWKFFYLAGENDEDLPEDLNEVNEELDGVADEVAVSATFLLNDHLGVPNDEATEEKKSSPKINLLIKANILVFSDSFQQ